MLRGDVPEWVGESVAADGEHLRWTVGNSKYRPQVRITTAGGQTKNVPAQRAIWAVRYGYVPRNKYVVRTCDDYRCVSPDHHKLADYAN